MKLLTPCALRASSLASLRALAGRPAVSLLLTLLAGVVSPPLARAALPAGITSNLLYQKGYLDVTLYSGVYNNDTNAASTTTGLQTAINDARDNGLVVYFPHQTNGARGVYRINDTLKVHTVCYNAPITLDNGDTVKPRSVAMVGETTGGVRPLIKLINNASGFNNANEGFLKPVVAFRNYTNNVTNPPADYPNNATPDQEHPSAGYFQMIRGLEIDCGATGNVGAVGLIFNQAQDSSIEDVKVTVGSGHTGIRGIPGRAAGAVNVEIVGGQYGLDTSPFGTNAGTSKGNLVSMVAGLKLSGQTVAPIRHAGFAMTIVGFDISVTGNIPAVKTSLGAVWDSANQKWTWTNDDADLGALSLVDGSITVPASGYTGTAISNPDARNLYVRNVYVSGNGTGSLNVVQSAALGAIARTGSFKRIQEYSYCNQGAAGTVQRETYNLLTSGANTTPSRSGDGTGGVGEVVSIVSATTKPADLLSRHIWGQLPSVNDDAFDYGETLGIDNGQEVSITASDFQSVIDANPRIFLRKGVYKIKGQITLRKDTVLYGVARHLTRIEADGVNWSPTPPTAEVSFIKTDPDPTAITYIGDLSIGVPSNVEANDWFTALEWKAGRNSMVHMGRPYHWPRTGSLATNPHTLVKINADGGGRWYFLGRGQADAMQDDGYRILKVDATNNVPLWIYGLNMEHASATSSAGIKYAEFNGAENIRIYSVKTEYDTDQTYGRHTTFLSFNDCKNVGIFSYGAIREITKPGFSVIDFAGASSATAGNFLVANVLPQDPDVAATYGKLVNEAVGTNFTSSLAWQGAASADPRSLALYKRGTLDDGTVMTHLNIGYGELPSGWTQRDIGTVGNVGSASYASNGATFTLNGSGADIWGTADEFCFVSKTLSGDKTIIARVVSLDNTDLNAKAGVMIREGTGAGARFAHMLVTPTNGTRFHYRTTSNGSVTNSGASDTNVAPYWVKLVRAGNLITASKSADGVTWTQVGTVTLSGLTTSVYYGLTTCSKVDGTLNTAVFDNVSVN